MVSQLEEKEQREWYTVLTKTNVGKGKADLYVNPRTGDIYAVNKKQDR